MLIAWLLFALERLAGVIPPHFLYGLARRAGALSLPIFEARRIAVRANQQRLHPEWGPDELNGAVRRVFEETAAYYVDAVIMPTSPGRSAVRVTPPPTFRGGLFACAA